MPLDTLKLLRISITIQVVVATWFIFSPDTVPDVIRRAEMENDRQLYAILDSIIVPLAHIHTLLCIALWWPTKLASWSYLAVAAAIAVLSSFAGPAIISAIDSLVSYIQVLASGATLCILYTHRFFGLGRSMPNPSIDTDAAR
ncbi:MAG: hypothetical protein LBQ81_09180 [Zoogloeaceae bacterium]|nr:hypothetical protein [Zoogloeaceae bacterium]